MVSRFMLMAKAKGVYHRRLESTVGQLDGLEKYCRYR